MMFTNKARMTTLLVICVLTMVFYIGVHQGRVSEYVKIALGYINDDVNPPDVMTRNGTLFERQPVQQIGTGIAKIDAEEETVHERSDVVGVGGTMIDLETAEPKELMNRMVIVTATSQNHLKESKGMIGSVQEFLPNTRIVMYDLGLTPSGIKEVRRLCNVELRPFDFSRYPSHVRNLLKFAWKPLIIQEALNEFGIVFWCDASARFKRNPLVLFSLLKEQHGFMSEVVQYKPDYMLIRTHPKMFEALGIDREKFKKDDGYAMCIEANRLLFVNSALVRRNIIEPWVDCALRPACIAPNGSVIRQFMAGPKLYTHRFDEAALALIIYKNLRGVFKEQNDRSELFHDVVKLSRSSQGYEKAKVCKSLATILE
ncbi:uncharacterized protein LOC119731716 [Patiria miniata]|uniref:Uncharacterized protein n=1 Tax=Patiria miniata TaxID=46514 RepID=A0A914AAS9_PATMI|nr:uncharacterized protein LOC119731716 [Patiria miniata]